MKYPGRVIKAGEQDATLVRALKRQLNLVLVAGSDPGLRLDPQDGNFGPRMKQTVKLFQARHTDNEGRPLKVDGEVGALSWEALFGAASVKHAATASKALLARALEIAAAAEARKVREEPKNSNRGTEVDEFLRRAGAPLGSAWCCAFVYWCLDEAAAQLGRANPMFRTAGCLRHWQSAEQKGARRISAAAAKADPSLVQPGVIFIMDYGKGLGHTGLIEAVNGGLVTTIEGNTDASQGREGGGVYRHVRKIANINKGYIDYSPVA